MSDDETPSVLDGLKALRARLEEDLAEVEARRETVDEYDDEDVPVVDDEAWVEFLSDHPELLWE